MMEPKLLFVGGFPSGGTDLLKTVLNAHPDINMGGEMPFLHLLPSKGYTSQTKLRNQEEVRDLARTLKWLDLYGNFRNLTHDFGPKFADGRELDLLVVLRRLIDTSESPVWGNKTPQNTEQLPTLLTLAPEAYSVIIIRDVRDVCLSWRKKWGKHLCLCADKWRFRMRKVWDYAQSNSPNRILFIQFEDMLKMPELTTRKITDHLQLEWNPAMLEHHKYTDTLDGKINYGHPIKADNLEKWRIQLRESEIRRIEEIAHDTMLLYGYEPAYAHQRLPIRRIERISGLWHDVLAMVFVGNRASQKNTFWYRLRRIGYEFRKRYLQRQAL